MQGTFFRKFVTVSYLGPLRQGFTNTNRKEKPRAAGGSTLYSYGLTYSLHCSSFLGLPYRILIIYLVKPKKGNYNGDYLEVQG